MCFLQSKTRCWIFLLLATLVTCNAFSQVTINLNVLPPYSPFYRDYAGYTSNKMIITILGSRNMQFYLSGSIRKDDNSISVQLKENYRPAIPINIVANMPQTLTGAQLRNVFGNGGGGDLLLTGITTKDIVMNQALPEGNYTICIQVRNYNTGQVIAEDCRNIYIAYYEPPQIISP